MKIAMDIESYNEIKRSVAERGLIQLLKDGIEIEVTGNNKVANIWLDETGNISISYLALKGGGGGSSSLQTIINQHGQH